MSVHEDTATLNFHIENHEQSLMRRLHRQTQEGRFSDITLTAHGVKISAHRAILCATSAYFEALLSGRWTTTSTYSLSEVLSSATSLKLLIDFMYIGKIEITKDNIEELLNAGTHLLMEDLRGACSKYLIANLAPKNCISIWQLAEQFELREVAAMCCAIAVTRCQDYLIKRGDMLEVNQAFIEKIIHAGLFNVVPKEEALQFVKDWKQHDDQNRVLSNDILKFLFSSISTGTIQEPRNNHCESSTLNNAEIANIQCNGGYMEAIFGYVMTEGQDFDVYMYFRDLKTWKFLDRFNRSSWSFLLQADHVGFIGQQAVFDGGLRERSAFVDFQQKIIRTIIFPNTSAVTRKMFCFDSHVFLLEDHKQPTGDIYSYTMIHTLYIYDPTSNKWEKIAKFDISELFPGLHNFPLHLSYTVIPQNNRAFIWAQDSTSRCAGVFWLGLQTDPLHRYTIRALTRPPLSKEDLQMPTSLSIRGWKHASFNMSADGQRVQVYGRQSLSKESLDFNLLLTYDQATNIWKRRENVSIALPQNNRLPIHFNMQMASNSQGYVQVGKSCRIQSLKHGSVYIIEKVCPFVVRTWACDIESGTWEQLAPTPVEDIEGFKSFDVVTVPHDMAVDLGTKPTYQGISDDAPHSPMLHWDLCLTGKLSVIKLQTNNAQRIQHTDCGSTCGGMYSED